MTKLIVEMEMPQACPCELATEIDGNYYPCFAYYGAVSRAKEFDDCMVNGTRPDWCPIKGELPDEHGDLIDRDALKKQCWHDDGFDLWVSHTEIDQQPIVIAAERKDDEQIH